MTQNNSEIDEFDMANAVNMGVISTNNIRKKNDNDSGNNNNNNNNNKEADVMTPEVTNVNTSELRGLTTPDVDGDNDNNIDTDMNIMGEIDENEETTVYEDDVSGIRRPIDLKNIKLEESITIGFSKVGRLKNRYNNNNTNNDNNNGKSGGYTSDGDAVLSPTSNAISSPQYASKAEEDAATLTPLVEINIDGDNDNDNDNGNENTVTTANGFDAFNLAANGIQEADSSDSE